MTIRPGIRYGTADGNTSARTKRYTKDLKTIHQDIIVALDTFKGRKGYHDDITILSCRVGNELISGVS